MGAVYDEDEELDFTFLRHSMRQWPGEEAAGGTGYGDGGRMPYPGAERWQGQAGKGGQGRASRGRSGQGRAVQEWGEPRRAPQNRGRQGAAARECGSAGTQRAGVELQGSGRTKKASPGRDGRSRVAQSGSRQGRASARRPLTMQEKQRQRQAAAQARRRRRLRRQKQLLAVLLCVLLAGTVYALHKLQVGVAAGAPVTPGGQGVNQVWAEGVNGTFTGKKIQGLEEGQFNRHPDWTEDFLTISEYSRPGDPLGEVKNIFVHYTANPKTSAAQNRSYFENLKDNHDVRGASAHFIIGIEGEILQIVPLDEMAYAVQTRNGDSISIECCYKYDDGQFTQETYDSLVGLLAWLVDTYELEADDILRHYDCGGKKCPLYYVEHEDAWRILKQDVEAARTTFTK